jgi:hypothetical protein
MQHLDKRILEELIYERVRLSVNLCQLVIFEQDLEKSIHRAMTSRAGDLQEQEALAREYIDKAWKRVHAEWEQLRSNIDGLDDD